MNSLRILVVTRSLPFHNLGGMEAVAWDLARSFVRRGTHVTILTTKCPSLQERASVDGVDIHCLPTKSGRYSREWWKKSADAFVTEYQSKVDIVFSVSAGAREIAKYREGPAPIFVAQAHGTAWSEFISKINQASILSWIKSIRNLISLFQDRSYRLFDAFVAVGEPVLADLRKNPSKALFGNVPSYLIENGVTPGRFAFDKESRISIRESLGIKEGDKALVSASRLHQQKGLREAISAFSLSLKIDQNLHYIIIGDGPDKAFLEQLAKSKGCIERIHFIGSISRDKIRQYLSAGDIFVFATTRVEGLPMNVLEALACGLPTIVSKHIEIAESGSVSVESGDIGSLSKAIIDTQPFSCRECRLPRRFTLEHSADLHLDLFRKLMSERQDKVASQ